jgi:hypothetical protein
MNLPKLSIVYLKKTNLYANAMIFFVHRVKQIELIAFSTNFNA